MWLGAKECDSFQNLRGQARVQSSHPEEEEEANSHRGSFCVAFSYPLWIRCRSTVSHCYGSRGLQIQDSFTMTILGSGVRLQPQRAVWGQGQSSLWPCGYQSQASWLSTLRQTHG